MRIELVAERGALRRWHLTLAERLARARRAEVRFALTPDAARIAGVDLLFQFETYLFALAGGGSAERIGPEALDGFTFEGPADLVVDLTREPRAGEGRVCLECDGAGLEPGLIAAAMANRPPHLAVVGANGVIAKARPGAERLGLVKAAFEEFLDRAATLLVAALGGGCCEAPSRMLQETPATFDPEALATSRFAKRAAKTVTQRAKRMVYEAIFQSPHWRVGWRRGERGLGMEGLGGGWTDLHDDGRRFYADPFPIERRGRTYLFVEEFEHAKAKGIISVVEFGADGPMGKPEPVLERPCHLSYPNVFERDGEMWMIPEGGGAGTVDLYRAREFPHRWTLEATLVDDVVANDATLIEHEGRWWMFATVRDGGGAYSDALWLWSAPDFRGPWTAHPRNPVMIDIASARPAGRMFVRDGALYRPVQDCRSGYGAAMALARVDRLDEGGFAQSVEALYRPGPEWPGRRVHSYNQAGGFEFIDGSAFAPRVPALRRPLGFAMARAGLRPAAV